MRLSAIGLLALLVEYGGIRMCEVVSSCFELLLNYKIVGRDNYVNIIDTNPPLAALYFGKDAKTISQIRPTLNKKIWAYHWAYFCP